MSAVDVAGRELKVGQTVAYQVTGGTLGLKVGKIVKINPKTVELDAPRARWQTTPLLRPFNALCIVEVTQ